MTHSVPSSIAVIWGGPHIYALRNVADKPPWNGSSLLVKAAEIARRTGPADAGPVRRAQSSILLKEDAQLANH